ncbi:RagB/SusD family nutrient uptake outer membrane protein [Puteibacter caeruleilacunae]|nr:RagB/SusD family nutrient uptake outer membrane protein [Puteibacter caeruleilacunae]
MKRTSILLIATICFLMHFASCDFLNVDEHFEDLTSIDSVFSNKINLEGYVFATAALFPDEGGIWGGSYTPGVTATDEAFVQWNQWEFPGLKLTLGEIDEDNLGSMNIWPSMYKIVRKSNTILARVDECHDLKGSDKREIIGYARFMRAYAYFRLLQNFGPFIILEDVLETNMDPDYYDHHRGTYDECCDYICTELEEAAKLLPLNVTISQFSRPTKGAAYGLVSRVRLQQASPMYNGGAAAKKNFAGWKRSVDDADYVSQEYDEEKWAKAAWAAKEVMNLGVYQLHTVQKTGQTPELPSNVSSEAFPNGAGDIDPYHSYKDMFDGEGISFKNSEFVWARYSGQVLSYTKHSFPVNLLGGWNGMAVPQGIIDAYYMVDGRTIENSSAEYPYSEDDFTTNPTEFSGYQFANRVHNMYINREARFYASIGFSGCFWPCLSTSENNRKNKVVTYHMGGTAGKDQTNEDTRNYPITGYVTKKYVHKEDAWKGEQAERLRKPFPIIRYAEILLNYAEAASHLTKAYTLKDKDGNDVTVDKDLSQIVNCFNQIRYRAGLPGITEADVNDPVAFQKLIERERMIEFFHENRRYYDVRRWGIVEEVESTPLQGMNTEEREDGYFVRVNVNHRFIRNRTWDSRMIFLPIPRYEIRKGENIDQNPGWGD